MVHTKYIFLIIPIMMLFFRGNYIFVSVVMCLALPDTTMGLTEQRLFTKLSGYLIFDK